MLPYHMKCKTKLGRNNAGLQQLQRTTPPKPTPAVWLTTLTIQYGSCINTRILCIDHSLTHILTIALFRNRYMWFWLDMQCHNWVGQIYVHIYFKNLDLIECLSGRYWWPQKSSPPTENKHSSPPRRHLNGQNKVTHITHLPLLSPLVIAIIALFADQVLEIVRDLTFITISP